VKFTVCRCGRAYKNFFLIQKNRRASTNPAGENSAVSGCFSLGKINQRMAPSAAQITGWGILAAVYAKICNKIPY
jgi:hypothetical protein